MNRLRAMIAALLLPASAAGCGMADAGQATCNRACLIGLTDRYLAALARRDPAAAPLARNVVFVENLQRLAPGEGLWATVTGGKGGFSIHVPDPVMQQGGWIGLVERNGKPVLLALRLKFEGGLVTEAEHIVAVPAGGNPGQLASPRPGLLAAVAQDRGLSHPELVRIGESYYDALDDNDGGLAPFAPDCQQVENGVITAGKGRVAPSGAAPVPARVAGDCAGQISSQAFVYIDRIDNRRIVAADRETGLVFGLSQFRHSMGNLPYKVILADGSTAERNRQNMRLRPFDLPTAHIFKIGADGLIHEIEVVGTIAPHNARSGWD